MNQITTVLRVTDVIKHGSNHDAPLSLGDLAKLIPTVKVGSLPGTLSRIMLTERHIHRRWRDSGKVNARGRRIPEYVYWFDKDYVNPLFGKERITHTSKERKKESGEMKRVRTFLSSNQPTPLHITVGGHSYTVSEARFLYRELKELFG